MLAERNCRLFIIRDCPKVPLDCASGEEVHGQRGIRNKDLPARGVLFGVFLCLGPQPPHTMEPAVDVVTFAPHVLFHFGVR